MTREVLLFGHVVGAILMGAGLIGVFLADLRSRQLERLALFAEAIRSIAVFYDGLVVPGALLLLGSGVWIIVAYGFDVLDTPWLAGMVGLFALEFVEGNTVTRRYFTRMRRLSREAVRRGQVTRELVAARAEHLPTFTHFLDLPVYLLIVSLGVVKPDDWTQFIVGGIAAVAVGAALTVFLPRLYPWTPSAGGDSDAA